MNRNNRKESKTDATQVSFSQAVARETIENGTESLQKVFRVEQANQALAEGERLINQTGKIWKNQTQPRLAGRVAEEHHAATFNAGAQVQGKPNLKAATTNSSGAPHSPSDVVVKSDGVVVDNVQIKYYKNGFRTAKALSDPKYSGMQKVCPSDQVRRVRSAAGREAVRNAPGLPIE